MSTTPQTPTPKQIDTPVQAQEEKILYILHYRRGDNPHPMNKFFKAPKAMKMIQLVERCKTYCTTMSYRFISVTPFESDLDMDEKKHNEQS